MKNTTSLIVKMMWTNSNS